MRKLAMVPMVLFVLLTPLTFSQGQSSHTAGQVQHGISFTAPPAVVDNTQLETGFFFNRSRYSLETVIETPALGNEFSVVFSGPTWHRRGGHFETQVYEQVGFEFKSPLYRRDQSSASVALRGIARRHLAPKVGPVLFFERRLGKYGVVVNSGFLFGGGVTQIHSLDVERPLPGGFRGFAGGLLFRELGQNTGGWEAGVGRNFGSRLSGEVGLKVVGDEKFCVVGLRIIP